MPLPKAGSSSSLIFRRTLTTEQHARWSPAFTCALVLALVLAAAVRFWGFAAFCLDGDEIFSLQVARLGWVRMTRMAIGDSVHPPLFYYLLHLWIGIGNDSLVWLRLLPVSIALAAMAPLVLLCRELNMRRR